MRIKPRPLARRGARELADQATCLAAAPAGGLIAAGSYDDAIEILDEDLNLLGKLEGHAGGCTALAFAAGGKLLVSTGEDGAAAVWCCERKALKARLACEGVDADRCGGGARPAPLGARVWRLRLRLRRGAQSRARYAAAASKHAAPTRPCRTRTPDGHTVGGVAVSPDGQLAACAAGKTVHLFEPAAGDVEATRCERPGMPAPS